MRIRPLASPVLLTLAFCLAFPSLAAEPPKPDGKALYAKKCAMCHSADGVAKATAKGSANLNDPEWQKKTTDEAIADVVVHGKNKMPKNDKLTPAEVEAIVAYVRSLK
jgi:cytochrome c6